MFLFIIFYRQNHNKKYILIIWFLSQKLANKVQKIFFFLNPLEIQTNISIGRNVRKKSVVLKENVNYL